MGSVLTARSTGKQTVNYYLKIINGRNVQKPDMSRVRVDVTRAEMNAYRKNAAALLENNKKLVTENIKVTADMLRTAALKTCQGIADRGTADYTFGLIPGSDDPLHFGHVSMGLAAIIFLNSLGERANGAVVATAGSNVPEKAEISAYKHRQNMAKITLEPVSEWIRLSSIRKLSEVFFDDIFTSMGFSRENRRAYCDMAGFNMLFALNPNMKWYYLTGSDKVNGYALKDEEALVSKTLFPYNVKVLYFTRPLEPVNTALLATKDWLWKLHGLHWFIESTVPSYDISSTRLKPMLLNGDPQANEEIEAKTIKYIQRHNILEVYDLWRRVKEKMLGKDATEYLDRIKHLRKEGLID